MSKEQTLDISWETIIKIFIAIFIFYIIYLARNIALWLFFAVAISILLDPAISALRKRHIPKIISILIVYLSIFGILGLLIYLSAPVFISEMGQFSQNLPNYFSQISPVLNQVGIDTAQNFSDLSEVLTGYVQQNSQGILKALMIFFGGLASTISILTMAFFLSLEENAPEKVLLLLFPQRYEDQIKNIFERVQKKVAGWFGARLLACLFVGVASYIVFFIFGIKYAFILALISGFLNFVPYIGPWITSILLIVLVAVSSGSWMMVLYVLISVTLVQEVENKLLTPLLMKKMTDIPPVLVLVSLFLGAEIFGFLGMIFAVPVFGIIYEFTKEFLEKRRVGEIEEE
ncbi:MAG: AI-2E family transporter [Candidatus Staskawiczbacteria bacterium]|nr:AI-2E family transporter [Candidatus Staskawiczbacteria bacterium]